MTTSLQKDKTNVPVQVDIIDHCYYSRMTNLSLFKGILAILAASLALVQPVSAERVWNGYRYKKCYTDLCKMKAARQAYKTQQGQAASAGMVNPGMTGGMSPMMMGGGGMMNPMMNPMMMMNAMMNPLMMAGGMMNPMMIGGGGMMNPMMMGGGGMMDPMMMGGAGFTAYGGGYGMPPPPPYGMPPRMY